MNPTAIFEVLSDSTADYDRTDKFEHYKQIASLQHYVLVSHRERALEVWTRSDAGWTHATYGEGAAAALGALGASIDVGELYERAAEPSA